MASSPRHHEHDDIDSTGAEASSQPSPRRISMEDYYYNQLFNVASRFSAPSDNAGELPPSYDTAVQSLRLPPSRFNVRPREDEGKEALPEYSCPIQLENVLKIKMELQCAVHKAEDRNWYQYWVVLQGTILKIHKTKRVGLFTKPKPSPKSSPDLPPGLKPGELLKSYTLQYAEVGIAADYIKRRYVIRLRVETDQFIISCIEIETFLSWLESLCAAIDLAPSIDERKIPADQSMPRIRRRRARQRATGMEEDGLIRRQQEIMRSQYPRLAEAIVVDESVQRSRTRSRTSGRSRSTPPPSRARPDVAPQAPRIPDVHPGTRVPISQLTSRRDSTSSQASASTVTLRGFLMTRPDSSGSNQPGVVQNRPAAAEEPGSSSQGPARPHMAPITQQLSASSVPNPSVSVETGKWQPVHHSSNLHDLLYAKRCMALLLKNSPRKTNLVVSRGTRWIIDWATGAMTRFEPPPYGDVELVGPWGFSPGGVIARI